MRIVTRPDFDGIVCAALLMEVFEITEPVLWVEPVKINNKAVEIKEGDILANLPYDERCSFWFDHHFTNSVDADFKGEYRLAPSAAGIIYDHFRNDYKKNFDKLIRETDRIDSARLTQEEIILPKTNKFVLLSFTIKGNNMENEAYWNKVVELIRTKDIDEIIEDKDVKLRIKKEIDNDLRYKEYLIEHTSIENGVSITDFRPFVSVPSGNRFLVFSLFPDTYVNVKIRNSDEKDGKVILSVGHSIFNRKCRVHCGKLVARFGGGGHFGAGSCSCDEGVFEDSKDSIISTLKKNTEI
ncbi:MAG: exopolyphosphatase [Acidobacteriota bacterium]